ncbi:MAG: hypothetical protein MZU91_08660 [Desulfosudis oleivorans]|nr:hypothetical protein [Desulfosudis oleivorans]
MMQESGVYDARPARPALSVGDPCLNPGAAMIGGSGRCHGDVSPGRLGRRGVSRREPDRQIRQHQHHGHRQI